MSSNLIKIMKYLIIRCFIIIINNWYRLIYIKTTGFLEIFINILGNFRTLSKSVYFSLSYHYIDFSGKFNSKNFGECVCIGDIFIVGSVGSGLCGTGDILIAFILCVGALLVGVNIGVCGFNVSFIVLSFILCSVSVSFIGVLREMCVVGVNIGDSGSSVMVVWVAEFADIVVLDICGGVGVGSMCVGSDSAHSDFAGVVWVGCGVWV